MQKHALTLATALLGVGILTACGSDKTTQPNTTVTYKATLSGANERPNPNTTTGTGTWTGTLDTQTNVLTYTMSYTGLSTNSTASHIHAQGDATTTANVVLNFQNFAGATTVFTPGTTSGSAAGTVNLSGGTVTGLSITGDSLKKAMDAGMAYVNVHTTANPGGEIRGQIVKQP
jgi:CHRD domain